LDYHKKQGEGPPPRRSEMATTLDSIVKLNSDRKAVRPTRVKIVEKELLQLLRSEPKHFQSKTPLSAQQLLNR
jgi:hypothetical protein